ncbi:MAG: ABC transporter substrate-binding protein [Candidatus Bathyarchaeia archaeon]|jgi:peptide/nickel transport system substrate-binding protein
MSTEAKPKPKRTTTYIAAAVLIIIMVAGAGYYFYQSSMMPPTPTTTTPTTSAGPQYKDTIVVGTTDSVQTTLDPADAYDYFANDVVMYNVGGGLVDYAPGTTTIVPNLATSWTVSSDGLTWTFNLRQGVKFADGTAFDANVVKYSIDRQMAIDEPEGPFAGVGLDTLINKTVVTGPLQVQFVLNQPFSAFLAMVAFNAMFPVNPNVAPMHAIVNYTGTVNTEVPNDIGPYMLSNWQRTAGKDVEMDFVPNPNWWNVSSGYPKTKNIIYKFYSDSTTLNLALQSGSIDIAYRQLAPADIQSYQSNTKFKVWQGPGQFIQYLVFNEKQAPFDKVDVRKAIATALDRSLITNTVFLGQTVPLYSMVPIGMSYHTDSFKTMYGDADTAKATSLLQSAGYSTSNPLKFTLTYPTGHYSSTDGIASALKQALEKTGVIQVTLANEPWANYKASTGADQLQVYIYGWYPDFIDPYDYTYPFLPPDGVGFLHTHYLSPTMSQLLHQAAGNTDPTAFPKIYTQIQDQVATDVPMVPLFQGTTIVITNPAVGGIVLDPTTIFRLYLMWETAS